MAGTTQVMAFIAGEISIKTYVNVMGQYRPCGRAAGIKALAAPLDRGEFREAVGEARKAGLSRLDRPRRVFAIRF